MLYAERVHVLVAHPGWRVERTGAGEDAREWARVLAGFDEGGAERLKDDGGTAVLRASLLGREVVLKRWDLGSLGARVRAVLRAAPADRHWRNAAWLAARGITTARPLALATEYRRPHPRRWLAMEHVPGRTLLQEIAGGDLGVRDEHSIAWLLGQQLARFRALPAYNRDHKPSNLIVTGDEEGSQIAVIDCIAIRRGRGGPDRMMASLLIEPAGCGLRVRRALRMRVLCSYLDDMDRPAGSIRRDTRDRLWRAVEGRVRAHGDPRPRVNPLGQRPPGT